MHKGNLPKRWGSGGLVRTDGLARQGFPLIGLGISDCGGCDGLAMACFVCTGADGLEKHCCLCISALCWGGGRFKWIGRTCSLILRYFLPCASMK